MTKIQYSMSVMGDLFKSRDMVPCRKDVAYIDLENPPLLHNMEVCLITSLVINCGGTAMLNQITLMGRLVRNPTVNRLANQTAVTSFTLAVERDYLDRYTQEKAVDFIPITAWGDLAEFASKFLKKGTLTEVHGRLQTWKSKMKSGATVKMFDISATKIYCRSSNMGIPIPESNCITSAEFPPPTTQEEPQQTSGICVECDGEFPF